MTHTLSLESFEDGLTDVAGPSKAFEQGYQEGLNAATATAAADQAIIDEKLVEALNGINFTYAEARGQLLGALAPLLSVIVKKILPHCVEIGFAEQLADILAQAAACDTATPMTLHIHPSQRHAVENATAKINAQLLIHEDPNLSKHAAWIRQDRDETLLDADNLLASISEALSAIQHPENRTKTHG